MTELSYEEFPVVDVPVIRDWYSPAFDALTSALWGRRSTIFVWGIFFWAWAIWQFVKLVLWIAGIVVITSLFAVTATVDLCTYKRRQRIATLNEWQAYLDAQGMLGDGPADA